MADARTNGVTGAGTREDPWRLQTPTGAGNPVVGFYGLKKGLRGRFAMYVPPVLEALRRAEVEHNAKNNRMRAV